MRGRYFFLISIAEENVPRSFLLPRAFFGPCLEKQRKRNYYRKNTHRQICLNGIRFINQGFVIGNNFKTILKFAVGIIRCFLLLFDYDKSISAHLLLSLLSKRYLRPSLLHNIICFVLPIWSFFPSSSFVAFSKSNNFFHLSFDWLDHF